MTTATELGTLRAPLAAAATAAAPALPASVPLTAAEPPGEEVPRAALVPGPGSRALAGQLAGAIDGRLMLLVSAELAAAIERDPLAGGLAEDAGPALAQAAAAFAQASGLAVELAMATVQEVPADLDDPSAECVAVPLLAGETHAATLVLLLDAPAGPPAEEPAAEAPEPEPEPEPELSAHEFQALDVLAAATGPGGDRSLEFLGEVELGVTAELGRARMTVRHVLSLVPGAVVELDRAAGSPVDVLVNGTLIARGEVVVVDEEFGIRITEIVGRDTDGAQGG